MELIRPEILWIVLPSIVALLYIAPTIIAIKKQNFAAIFLLNLVFGWTFLGWVGALVWAALSPKKEGTSTSRVLFLLIIAVVVSVALVVLLISTGLIAPPQIFDEEISSETVEISTEVKKEDIKENWRKIHKGLTKKAVVDALGEPRRIEGGVFERWDYSEGQVTFDEDRVYGWDEPMWY